jgi:hypothetical protein
MQGWRPPFPVADYPPMEGYDAGPDLGGTHYRTRVRGAGVESIRQAPGMPPWQFSASWQAGRGATFNALEFFLARHAAAEHFIWYDLLDRTFRDVLIGYGDGSTKVFPIWCRDSSSHRVTVAGEPQLGSGYSVEATNVLASDNDASIETDTSGWGARNSATLSQETACSVDGDAALKVVTPGSVAEEGAYPQQVEASAGDVLCFSCWIWAPATVSLELVLWWEDASSSTLSYDTGTAFDATTSWTRHEFSATAPASTAYVYGAVWTESSVAKTFYVDAAQLEYGAAATDWHLPTEAPDALVFDSAPASGDPIRVTATGKWGWPCRLTSLSKAERSISGFRASWRSVGYQSGS